MKAGSSKRQVELEKNWDLRIQSIIRQLKCSKKDVFTDGCQALATFLRDSYDEPNVRAAVTSSCLQRLLTPLFADASVVNPELLNCTKTCTELYPAACFRFLKTFQERLWLGLDSSCRQTRHLAAACFTHLPKLRLHEWTKSSADANQSRELGHFWSEQFQLLLKLAYTYFKEVGRIHNFNVPERCDTESFKSAESFLNVPSVKTPNAVHFISRIKMCVSVLHCMLLSDSSSVVTVPIVDLSAMLVLFCKHPANLRHNLPSWLSLHSACVRLVFAITACPSLRDGLVLVFDDVVRNVLVSLHHKWMQNFQGDDAALQSRVECFYVDVYKTLTYLVSSTVSPWSVAFYVMPVLERALLELKSRVCTRDDSDGNMSSQASVYSVAIVKMILNLFATAMTCCSSKLTPNFCKNLQLFIVESCVQLQNGLHSNNCCHLLPMLKVLKALILVPHPEVVPAIHAATRIFQDACKDVDTSVVNFGREACILCTAICRPRMPCVIEYQAATGLCNFQQLSNQDSNNNQAMRQSLDSFEKSLERDSSVCNGNCSESDQEILSTSLNQSSQKVVLEDTHVELLSNTSLENDIPAHCSNTVVSTGSGSKQNSKKKKRQRQHSELAPSLPVKQSKADNVAVVTPQAAAVEQVEDYILSGLEMLADFVDD